MDAAHHHKGADDMDACGGTLQSANSAAPSKQKVGAASAAQKPAGQGTNESHTHAACDKGAKDQASGSLAAPVAGHGSGAGQQAKHYAEEYAQLATMHPMASLPSEHAGRGSNAAGSATCCLETATSVGAPYAVVVGPQRTAPATHAPNAPDDKRRRLQQLSLRDAIFAGVMEPTQDQQPGADEAPGLAMMSPQAQLDPLSLLRMSMLNTDLPSPSPRAGGGGGVMPPIGGGGGGAGPGIGGGGSSGGTGAKDGAAEDNDLADAGRTTWQRRRRISAVIREELAEVAKALEAGLPQVARQIRRQPSALRGLDEAQRLQLIPTPSGPPSGAVTPGVSSPMHGVHGAGSSNPHFGSWQQQQQQQQQLLLQPQQRQGQRSTQDGTCGAASPATGVGRRAKRPADVAAEQLAARVLAAHKGNWVSALHKLASAVGRQLQNAREATGSQQQQQQQQQDQYQDQYQDQHANQQQSETLPEPEIAAREVRLRRVLVRGTRAARAVATHGLGGLTPQSAGPDVGQRQQQKQQGASEPPVAQRQLQLLPEQQQPPTQQLGQDAMQQAMQQQPGSPPTSCSAVASSPGAPLPQAWASGVTMPHQRPRLGPSRLAHQSSMQHAWGEAFEQEAAAAAAVEVSEAMQQDAAAAAAAIMSDMPMLTQPSAIHDPVLQMQHLQLQHVHMTILPHANGNASGASPLPAGVAGHAPPPGTGVQALLQHHAAHFDEPVISLRDARREARSRSTTPAIGTPRAGVPALTYFGGGAAGAAAAAASQRAFAAAMEVDADLCMAVERHEDEDDEDSEDPIAAQLAAEGAGGGAAGGGSVAVPIAADLDVEPFDDEDLAAAAAAVAQQELVIGGPLQLHPHGQAHLQPAAPHTQQVALQYPPQMMQQPAHMQPMALQQDGAMVGVATFGVQQVPGNAPIQ